MDKRLGVVAIVVEDVSAAVEINAILHAHADVIVGRMGIPYRERGVSVISVIVDGRMDALNALTGRLGRVPHTSVMTALSRELPAGPGASACATQPMQPRYPMHPTEE